MIKPDIVETIERESRGNPEEEQKRMQPVRDARESKTLRANRLGSPPVDDREPEIAGRGNAIGVAQYQTAARKPPTQNNDPSSRTLKNYLRSNLTPIFES